MLDWYLLQRSRWLAPIVRKGVRCHGPGRGATTGGLYDVGQPGQSFFGWALAAAGLGPAPPKQLPCNCGLDRHACPCLGGRAGRPVPAPATESAAGFSRRFIGWRLISGRSRGWLGGRLDGRLSEARRRLRCSGRRRRHRRRHRPGPRTGSRRGDGSAPSTWPCARGRRPRRGVRKRARRPGSRCPGLRPPLPTSTSPCVAHGRGRLRQTPRRATPATTRSPAMRRVPVPGGRSRGGSISTGAGYLRHYDTTRRASRGGGAIFPPHHGALAGARAPALGARAARSATAASSVSAEASSSAAAASA